MTISEETRGRLVQAYLSGSSTSISIGKRFYALHCRHVWYLPSFRKKMGVDVQKDRNIQDRKRVSRKTTIVHTRNGKSHTLLLYRADISPYRCCFYPFKRDAKQRRWCVWRKQDSSGIGGFGMVAQNVLEKHARKNDLSKKTKKQRKDIGRLAKEI